MQSNEGKQTQNGIGVDSREIYNSMISLGIQVGLVGVSRFGRINLPVRDHTRNETVWFNQVTLAKKPSLRKIIRIHDVFPLTNPEWFTKKSIFNFRLAMQNSIENGNLFVCNSKTTASNLGSLYPQISDRVKVVYCVPPRKVLSGPSICSCDGCSLLKNGLVSDYIVSIGTIEPRKDYRKLIKIIETNQISSKIVILGNRGWLTKDLISDLLKLKFSGNVVWIEKSCDSSLHEIVYRSIGYLCTSIDEGYGIPSQIARGYGKPIVLPDINVFRELHNDYAGALFCRDIKDYIDSIQEMSNLQIIQFGGYETYYSKLHQNQKTELSSILL
jgi:glycosyltransferase involved in cell wall biosynthesis